MSVMILWGVAVVGSAFAAAERPAKPAPSTEQATRSAKPSIQNGMTTETVLALIGKPREVKPIEAEGVRGESWIYRRTARQIVNQVAPTVEKVPAWGGPGVNRARGEIIDVNVPFLRNERVTIYQMTALLFIDGKVVASKQWTERDRDFD